MRLILIIICSLFLVCCGTKQNQSFKQSKQGVLLSANDGTLGIFPISENAVRVKFMKDTLEELPELIFTDGHSTPDFKVSENDMNVEISTKKLRVLFNKQMETLSYTDESGNAFLNETAGSRTLISDSISGEKCYVAAQTFDTKADEQILGLGQFQDGHYNIRGITRRLTQVNTQIALPFIYSSKGYGILWHQYGMTDFNPANNDIQLHKEEKPSDDNNTASVTTTSGTRRMSQFQSSYTGQFSVPHDGEYVLFLDLGTMGNRHYVAIDGKPVLDQRNIWLPPTASSTIQLKKGQHTVELICKADNNPSLFWKTLEPSTTFRSPVTKMLDYVVFYGPSADHVIKTYRDLSGDAPLFPKWAYGFWQCRERYSSSEQLIATVKEFRERNLPLDVIVQDWQYWGQTGWGVPQFDPVNYPNPSGFIKELHDLHAHFNISIWSNPDKNSDIGREYVNNNLFIPDTKWLDYFNPETRKAYWNTLNQNMFSKGVDSWWMDAVEPENDALQGTTTSGGAGDFYRLTYPYFVSKAVYEGQRNTSADKRVCILTRSAFPGQQRYGVINWSGDIGGDWDTYQRQIVAGLNFTISGFPYWTTDIGGFFRPGNAQYTDPDYQELLTRWFQWGAFNPIFRLHGYQSETEPWKYGETVTGNMQKIMKLRYSLLPYIYSEAWQVTHNGSTIMRPLVMDFRTDVQALKQPYEYMFGKSILVAPVTEPGITKKDIYLPECAGWYDYWTKNFYQGGQSIQKETPLDIIPLYIKAGAIMPVSPDVQYSSEKEWDNLTLQVYEGANGEFTLYEDEGDNYNYESGKYTTITFQWNDANKTLHISDRQGTYSGMYANRKFMIALIKKSGAQKEVLEKEITYSGVTTEIILK